MKLPPEERQYAGDLALRQARAAREQNNLSLFKGKSASDAAPLPVLTGATFEERRQQFEAYLHQAPAVKPLAFVEASTTNTRSDLFSARLMIGSEAGERFEISFAGTPDPESERQWRSWYWEGAQNAHRIYHSLVGETGTDYLPQHLFGRLAAALIAGGDSREPKPSVIKRWRRLSTGQLQLPKPDQIADLLRVAVQSDWELNSENKDILGRFLDLAGLDELGAVRSTTERL